MPHEHRFRDGVHGLLVQAVGLLIGEAFPASDAGSMPRAGAQAMAAAGARGGLAADQQRPAVTSADYAFDYLMRPSTAAAFLAAARLAIGCAAACAGATMGDRHRDERTEVYLFGTKFFW